MAFPVDRVQSVAHKDAKPLAAGDISRCKAYAEM